MRKMERAENSDVDASLATVNKGNIFREKKFRNKVPFNCAILRIRLGKEHLDIGSGIGIVGNDRNEILFSRSKF